MSDRKDMETAVKEWNTRAGWQPIDTAPKDGTEIIVLFVGKSGAVRRRVANYSKADDADWLVDGSEVANCWTPTHWMPLPQPPEA